MSPRWGVQPPGECNTPSYICIPGGLCVLLMCCGCGWDVLQGFNLRMQGMLGDHENVCCPSTPGHGLHFDAFGGEQAAHGALKRGLADACIFGLALDAEQCRGVAATP